MGAGIDCLGSSLGDRALYLRKALLWIAHDPYMDLVCTSSVWQTMPIGAAKNVFTICVPLIPHILQRIDASIDVLRKRCNRLRGSRMDRTLDLDVLLYA